MSNRTISAATGADTAGTNRQGDFAVPALLAAAVLLAASVAYATFVVAMAPPLARPAEAMAVFAAGAFPGLLVSFGLRALRPARFSRAVRRQMIGVSLLGAAATIAPFLLAGH